MSMSNWNKEGSGLAEGDVDELVKNFNLIKFVFNKTESWKEKWLET